MRRIKIKNIVFLFFILSRLLIVIYGSDLQFDNEQKSLRQLLEKFRKTYNINFIYADKLINDISVNQDQHQNLTRENLKSFLEQYGISYKKFGEKTFVLIKSNKKKVDEEAQKIIVDEPVFETDSLSLVIKPILISNPKPPYPYKAVQDKIEGSVRIKFLVGVDGSVSRSEILATSGYSILDSAAKNFVYNMKYSPAKKDGKPQNAWMSILFRYVLEESENKLIPKVSY